MVYFTIINIEICVQTESKSDGHATQQLQFS
jgi:hypothetical protein